MKKEKLLLEYGHITAWLFAWQAGLLAILGLVLDNTALSWTAFGSAIIAVLFYCEAENSKFKLFPSPNGYDLTPTRR